MCRTEEFITEKSYGEKIDNVVRDYMNNHIPSICFDDLGDDDQKELAALYLFKGGERREIAESILVDVLIDEMDSWISIFMWGALQSMGYGKKYAVKAHNEMFSIYMGCLKKHIQNDLDDYYSRMDNYTYEDISDEPVEDIPGEPFSIYIKTESIKS